MSGQLRQRLDKLEGKIGGASGLHFLPVEVGANESKDEALERSMAERGITRDQLGRALYIGGGHGMTVEDFQPYERTTDLVGNRAFVDELRGLMGGSGVGLPSEGGEVPDD